IDERTGIAALIAGVSPGNETCLQMRCCTIELTDLDILQPQCVARHRDAPSVVAAFIESEAHLDTRDRLFVFALNRSEHAGVEEQTGIRSLVVLSAGELHDLLDRATAFDQMIRFLPEAEQRDSH